MSDDLDKLIEAVEAGTLTGDDDLSYPSGVPEMIEGALGMDIVWDTVCLAHDGSLNDARDLHKWLLPGWEPQLGLTNAVVFLRTHKGNDPTYSGMSAVMSRAWLLAILRAYRATLTASARPAPPFAAPRSAHPPR